MQAPEELRTRAVMLEAGVEAGRRERASEDWYYLFLFRSIVFCNILRIICPQGETISSLQRLILLAKARVAR